MATLEHKLQQQLEDALPVQPLHESSPNANAASPISNSDLIACMWLNCGERLPGAEALYDHVCERHIGRKSTNNLNLTCQWGSCRTQTVKRDHITSHMRVHVPLKPHKCDFCGKAFKRPQDLKKHVKTHAEDSIMMSRLNGSPDLRTQLNQSHYGDHGMGNSAYTTSGHNGGANGGFYPNSQSYNGYGQVNYPGTNLADQQSMDTRRRAIEALNDFLGDVKRRALDPSAYYDVGQRLNTQSLPLPVSIGQGYSIGNGHSHHANAQSHSHNHNYNYNSNSGINNNASILESYGASASSLLNGTGNMPAHGAMAQNYALPMSNARTKGDLLDIDRFLEQLQATVYESSGQAAAAGVQQPGVHTHLASGYNGYNSSYRSSHSPPQGHHSMPPATSMPPLSSVAQMANMSASGQSGVDTPALTPASVSSYTSGHSPVSSHSRASVDSSTMYPQLPSVTGMSDMGHGYNSAPPAGLASGFDGYDSRRYSGGRLQREAPARADPDSMDIDTDGQRTPRKLSLSKEAPSEGSPSNVDPALRTETETTEPAAPAADSEETPRSDTTEDKEDKAQDSWVENVRVIEQLRAWVRARLEGGDFERDADSTPEASADNDMKAELEQAIAAEPEPQPTADVEVAAEAPKEEEEPIAYPTLKAEEE